MPRNSQGVMSLPAGNPVVPGTLIESTWANPTMTDLANEITQSLPRNGSAGMTGPLILSRDGILPKEATTVDQLTAYVSGSNSYLPAGAIQAFAMAAIPTGWLECNGDAVSRTTYANLFATIGTTYGAGNGTTTFNIPDLRGEFIRGWDHGRNVDPGRALGSGQAGANKSHTHPLNDPGHLHPASALDHAHSITDPGNVHAMSNNQSIVTVNNGGDLNITDSPQYGSSGTIASATTGIVVNAAHLTVGVGAGWTGATVAAEGIEARPNNVAMVYCIKAFGALQTDGLGSMAFQNKEAVVITGGTATLATAQVTTAPTAPNDVLRLADASTLNPVTITSTDTDVLSVDIVTVPGTTILRPSTNTADGLAKLDGNGWVPQNLMYYTGMWSGAVPRTYESKAREVVSVLDFGAVGDRITDDGPALAAAVATGLDVYIPHNLTFLMNNRTLVLHTGQRLYGGGTLVKTTSDNDLPSGGAQDGPKFIKIEGKDECVVDSIRFEYLVASSPRLYGVTVENSSNTQIINCVFLGQVSACFVWKNSVNTLFANNRTAGGAFAIATGGDAAGNTDGPVLFTTIYNNYISDSTSEAIDINWDTKHCLIDSNFIYNHNIVAGEEEIDIGGGVCNNITVSNNYLNSMGHALEGINVKLNTTNVKLLNNTIVNGNISNTNSRGIYIDGKTVDVTPATVANCQVEGNTISGFTRGITVAGINKYISVIDNTVTTTSSSANAKGIETGGTTTGIDIVGNRVNGSTTTGGAGIYLNSMTKGNVSGNTVYNYVGAGIQVFSASEATVSANTVFDCTGDGIVLLGGSSKVNVTGNIITNCDDGIVCLAQNSTISGNRSYLNKKCGIILQADNLTCANNTSYDNSVTVTGDSGILLQGGSDFAIISGNQTFDTRGTNRQIGIRIVSASDRCIIQGNISYDNNTYNIQNEGALTNSVVANNITA